MQSKILKIALPSGSLNEAMTNLFIQAGYIITEKNRSYFPQIDDNEIELARLRPQEIPRYVSDGKFDIGISGLDLITESEREVVHVMEIPRSKKGSKSVKVVIAVAGKSPYKKIEDLEDKLIATEYVNLTRKYFKENNIHVNIELSCGSTEAKPPYLADAIVDHLDSGETFKANDLRIIDEILISTNRLIANKESLKDNWKNKKIQEVSNRLKLALEV